MRSIAPLVWAGNTFTVPSPTTRKPTGCTDTPAPVPPAKGNTSVGTGWFLPSSTAYSPPPATKPKLTLEMGMMVVPWVPLTGAPTTVFTSTMLRMLCMVVCIMLSMGCCCCIAVLLAFDPFGIFQIQNHARHG